MESDVSPESRLVTVERTPRGSVWTLHQQNCPEVDGVGFTVAGEDYFGRMKNSASRLKRRCECCC